MEEAGDDVVSDAASEGAVSSHSSDDGSQGRQSAGEPMDAAAVPKGNSSSSKGKVTKPRGCQQQAGAAKAERKEGQGAGAARAGGGQGQAAVATPAAASKPKEVGGGATRA